MRGNKRLKHRFKVNHCFEMSNSRVRHQRTVTNTHHLPPRTGSEEQRCSEGATETSLSDVLWTCRSYWCVAFENVGPAPNWKWIGISVKLLLRCPEPSESFQGRHLFCAHQKTNGPIVDRVTEGFFSHMSACHFQAGRVYRRSTVTAATHLGLLVPFVPFNSLFSPLAHACAIFTPEVFSDGLVRFSMNALSLANG